PDHEEEDHHQTIVDPKVQILSEHEVAEAEDERRVPQVVIAFVPGRVGPGHRDDGHHQKQDAARGLHVHEVFERPHQCARGQAPGGGLLRGCASRSWGNRAGPGKLEKSDSSSTGVLLMNHACTGSYRALTTRYKSETALKSRFAEPSRMPASAMPEPPTLAGFRRAAPRAMMPATIAATPVTTGKHNNMPHTRDTTAAVLAGGFSPRGNPVFGSIVMACSAMVSGLPVMGFAARPGGP